LGSTQTPGTLCPGFINGDGTDSTRLSRDTRLGVTSAATVLVALDGAATVVDGLADVLTDGDAAAELCPS
jgi:hypothetical protein